LPRHVGQAQALRSRVDIRLVVQLACSAEVVLARLRSNVGGDRSARRDDAAALVRAKLATYRERTVPLVDHLKAHGAHVEVVCVSSDTRPADVLVSLSPAAREAVAGVPSVP
jgi:adenylate kinase family enzyme